jgi:hypothetical protein
MALGIEQLSWSDSVWKTLDDAVHDESQRTAVGLKFIPFRGQADDSATAPADAIDTATMTIDEASVAALVEFGVAFLPGSLHEVTSGRPLHADRRPCRATRHMRQGLTAVRPE